MYLAAPVHICTCKYTPTHIYVNYHIGTYTMTPASSRGTCIFKRQKHTGKHVQTHIYFLKEAQIQADGLSSMRQNKFKSVISGDWVIHPSARICIFCLNCEDLPASSRGCVRFEVTDHRRYWLQASAPPLTLRFESRRALKITMGVAVTPQNWKVPLANLVIAQYVTKYCFELKYKASFDSFIMIT